MILFKEGNLLEANVEALVNSVNTVGVMGKGVALMFKERYPDNYRQYARACKNGKVKLGRIFWTETTELFGPRWILNFPTKGHWRFNSQLEWIECGMQDLVRVIDELGIRSIAIPPLGCGNGRLKWRRVKRIIVEELDKIDSLEAWVYIPTSVYQNTPKQQGVESLTPARALTAEMVRRYCQVNTDCTILEIQKLAWLVERAAGIQDCEVELRFKFTADRYGPYSFRLIKLLEALDGSYLRCTKRLTDAKPEDNIWFDASRTNELNEYLLNEGAGLQPVVELVSEIADGFESPYGMELLTTVDWLVHNEGIEPQPVHIRNALSKWPAGREAGERKRRLFDEETIEIALSQLKCIETSING